MRCLFLLPLTAALGASPAPQEASPPLPPTEQDGGTLAIGAISTRMTVPVSIGGALPRPFIIDTGAERSVVSRQLAGQLGLIAGPQVRLTTMTGSSQVPTVVVPSLTVGPVRDVRAFNAPALEAAHLGAHGLLGV